MSRDMSCYWEKYPTLSLNLYVIYVSHELQTSFDDITLVEKEAYIRHL
jgi:hypothetical protein